MEASFFFTKSHGNLCHGLQGHLAWRQASSLQSPMVIYAVVYKDTWHGGKLLLYKDMC